MHGAIWLRPELWQDPARSKPGVEGTLRAKALRWRNGLYLINVKKARETCLFLRLGRGRECRRQNSEIGDGWTPSPGFAGTGRKLRCCSRYNGVLCCPYFYMLV
jgi:hypothetical protein